MIPEKLEDWNLDVIEELVKKNINESDRHDFKFNLSDADNLTKISCAFANTKGGFIVLGVKDSNLRFNIKGIDEDKELAHKFGSKIINAQPSIDFDLPKIICIPDSQKVLAVIHIPLSDERPHIPSPPEKRIFWKRTNKGNVEMTYDEIRMSFQHYEERREKVKLLYLELLSNIQTLDEMKITPTNANMSETYSLLTLDSSIISSLLTELYNIIGDDIELIKYLFTLKREIQVINSENKIFQSQVAQPLSNLKEIIEKHNKFINDKIDFLKPIAEKAITRLEKRFGLQNPLLY